MQFRRWDRVAAVVARWSRLLFGTILLVGLLQASLASRAPAQGSVESRIKDLATMEGLTREPLVGYGLVVGLSGTGDPLFIIQEAKGKQSTDPG